MTKPLNDLLEDYGDACYRNSDDAIDLKRQILCRFDELVAQRSMHEEIIKSAYARCRELEQQISGRDRKPIAYYKKIDRVGVFGDIHAFAYYKKDDSYMPLYAEESSNRKPIGYLPAYVVRTISNDGAWDSFTLSRERSDPTDIEVFL